jgi:hypothetical protein
MSRTLLARLKRVEKSLGPPPDPFFLVLKIVNREKQVVGRRVYWVGTRPKNAVQREAEILAADEGNREGDADDLR